MPEITVAAVKALREKTQLPLMDCKRALEEAGGDQEKAVELLRKAGAKVAERRAGRATTAGRIAVYADFAARVGAMVDLRCETAPVARNEGFAQLAEDLVRQLALGPGAQTPAELLSQPSPRQPGSTLGEQFDELNNRIREAFRLERIVRIDGTCAGYAHHNAAVGVLVQVEGGEPQLARDICMHIAALRPQAVSREQLDPARIEKEREILTAAARREGKPEKIIAKMVEGRLQNFFAENCLLDQPFVKAEDGKTTVGKVAKQAGMRIIRFVHWELPRE